MFSKHPWPGSHRSFLRNYSIEGPTTHWWTRRRLGSRDIVYGSTDILGLFAHHTTFAYYQSKLFVGIFSISKEIIFKVTSIVSFLQINRLTSILITFCMSVGLSSLGILAINEHALGGLVLPSHEYTWEMEDNTGTNLPFFKRLSNFVNMWRSLHYVYHEIFPQQQKLAEKYFGPLPPMLDVLKNVSMLFINQADVMAPARPKLANVITFTSSHIEKVPKPLPKVGFIQ